MLGKIAGYLINLWTDFKTVFCFYRSWVVCGHFKHKTITLPPLTRSQLALNLEQLSLRFRFTGSYIQKAYTASWEMVLCLNGNMFANIHRGYLLSQ